MQLVKCTEEFWEFVRLLRINEKVIDGFIENSLITSEMQISYMKKNSDFYRIAIYNGEPAGFVGVINEDIRICTHPNFQGKGVGKFMIKECVKLWPKSFAKIKTGNYKSERLFLSVGFEIFKQDQYFKYLRIKV